MGWGHTIVRLRGAGRRGRHTPPWGCDVKVARSARAAPNWPRAPAKPSPPRSNSTNTVSTVGGTGGPPAPRLCEAVHLQCVDNFAAFAVDPTAVRLALSSVVKGLARSVFELRRGEIATEGTQLVGWQIERVTALDLLDLEAIVDELVALYAVRCEEYAAMRRLAG